MATKTTAIEIDRPFPTFSPSFIFPFIHSFLLLIASLRWPCFQKCAHCWRPRSLASHSRPFPSVNSRSIKSILPCCQLPHSLILQIFLHPFYWLSLSFPLFHSATAAPLRNDPCLSLEKPFSFPFSNLWNHRIFIHFYGQFGNFIIKKNDKISKNCKINCA